MFGKKMNLPEVTTIVSAVAGTAAGVATAEPLCDLQQKVNIKFNMRVMTGAVHP